MRLGRKNGYLSFIAIILKRLVTVCNKPTLKKVLQLSNPYDKIRIRLI